MYLSVRIFISQSIKILAFNPHPFIHWHIGGCVFEFMFFFLVQSQLNKKCKKQSIWCVISFISFNCFYFKMFLYKRAKRRSPFVVWYQMNLFFFFLLSFGLCWGRNIQHWLWQNNGQAFYTSYDSIPATNFGDDTPLNTLIRNVSTIVLSATFNQTGIWNENIWHDTV